MAKKLDDTKVKMGNLIPVSNMDKKNAEATHYFAVKMEDQTGKKENWYLFTGKEMNSLTYAEMDVNDAFKPGRMYYRHRVGRSTNWKSFVVLNFPGRTVKVDGTLGKEKTWAKLVTISDTMLKKAAARAKRNPEDIPEMGWLEDLKD